MLRRYAVKDNGTGFEYSPFYGAVSIKGTS